MTIKQIQATQKFKNEETRLGMLDSYMNGQDDDKMSKMVDLDCEGFTEDDCDIMRQEAGNDSRGIPRIEEHKWGFILFCCSDEDCYPEWSMGLIELGLSHDLVVTYYKACKDGAILVNCAV